MSGAGGFLNPMAGRGGSMLDGSGGAGFSAGGGAARATGGTGFGGAGGATVLGDGGAAGAPTANGGTSDGAGGATTSSGGSNIASGGFENAGGSSADGGESSSGDGGASNTPNWPRLDASQIGSPTMISNSFTLAESPVWDHCGHRLLFTDVTASVIHTLDAGGRIGVFARNTGNANGIAFDIDGSLLLAQMGGAGSIARRDKSGNIRRIDTGLARLHTPDDITVRSDGTIYFSDGEFPPIGAINLGALPVYALKPGSSTLQNGGSVAGPNGIELSPDEKTLYVDAYFEGNVVKFTVAEDGSISKGAVFARGLPNTDSLCLDAAGNLYVGFNSGIQVFRPDGAKVKVISIPSLQGTTSCSFGGEDGTTLYITAWTSLWKLEGMPIPGLEWMTNKQRLAARCDE